MKVYCSLCGHMTNVECVYCGYKDESKLTAEMIKKLLLLEANLRLMHSCRLVGQDPTDECWLDTAKTLRELSDLRQKENIDG